MKNNIKNKDTMFGEKPSLLEEFVKHGVMRDLIQLIEKYDYTNEEVSLVMNVYEPYENNTIPEVEHIRVLLHYFPKSTISQETMAAIKNSYPDSFEYITRKKLIEHFKMTPLSALEATELVDDMSTEEVYMLYEYWKLT